MFICFVDDMHLIPLCIQKCNFQINEHIDHIIFFFGCVGSVMTEIVITILRCLDVSVLNTKIHS